MSAVSKIENNELYKTVLSDSFGGCMYNVDNFKDYCIDDVNVLLELFKNVDINSIDGIMKGAYNFINDMVNGN